MALWYGWVPSLRRRFVDGRTSALVRPLAPLYGGSPPTHAGSGSMLRHVLRGQTSPLSSASPATLYSKVTFFSLSILRMLTCDLPGCPGYLGPWSLTMAPSALRPP